jgi:hypothetical protein
MLLPSHPFETGYYAAGRFSDLLWQTHSALQRVVLREFEHLIYMFWVLPLSYSLQAWSSSCPTTSSAFLILPVLISGSLWWRCRWFTFYTTFLNIFARCPLHSPPLLHNKPNTCRWDALPATANPLPPLRTERSALATPTMTILIAIPLTQTAPIRKKILRWGLRGERELWGKGTACVGVEIFWWRGGCFGLYVGKSTMSFVGDVRGRGGRWAHGWSFTAPNQTN